MPSVSIYDALRITAEMVGAWPACREAARETLRNSDVRALVTCCSTTASPTPPGSSRLTFPTGIPAPNDGCGWPRHGRQSIRPTPWRSTSLADQVLETTGRAAYAGAVAILKRARRAAGADGTKSAFEAHVTALRERHRRRPAFITMIDKAGLS
jgi:hypothetical protein